MPDAPDARREKVMAAQRCARAAMTATLHGALHRDRASIDMAHDMLVAGADEGLLLAAAQSMAVEFASFVAALAEVGHFDPEALWANWCTSVNLPDRPG